MIQSARGNLLEADAQALVNTVNCEGFMGKGIALQFKKAFPDNFLVYQRACRGGQLKPGSVLVFDTQALVNPRYIINVATKNKWRERSRLEYIESGLNELVVQVQRLGLGSLAVPPLGTGLGGLKWSDVKPLMERAFARLPGVRVLLFEPRGAPAARNMPVRTKRPRLTLPRALFVRLAHEYASAAYRLTLLEMQKLAYLLQEAGEPLRLKYVAHLYGPYAHALNKVLENLEGHYIRGYGDTQRPDVEIEVLPGAVKEADGFLLGRPGSASRLRKVADLIAGFETPYGMELLSSVHWVGAHADPAARDSDSAVQAVHAWNDRKREMLAPEHIQIAWNRLQEQGWLPHHGDS